MGREPKHDERGLSARYLVLIFLMGVGACAVFFSLGFLVGYNERGFKRAEATEQVTPSPVIPPTVNPPLEKVETAGDKSPSVTSTASAPATSTPVAASKSATETVPPSAPAAQAGEVATGFAVQVSASRNKQDAERLVKELSSRGYPVFLVAPEYARTNDNLFRVQVGPFATREEAEKVRDKLVKEGFKPFIRH